MISKIKNLILHGENILFPRVCFNCQKEENYLCQDCQSLLEISGFHKKHPTGNISDLYFAFSYENHLVKSLVRLFKYEPFVKELGKLLSSLIIAHFKLMDNKPEFYTCQKNGETAAFVMLPVPLHKKRLKWRGFNQAEILGKELAEFFKIPLVSDCLIKIKKTTPQTELDHFLRKENLKSSFSIKKQKEKLISGKKILLVDDVYTTGSTMQEYAGALRAAGARKVIGIVFARG